MTTKFIGVDPGLSGAIAIYTPPYREDGIFTAPERPAELAIFDIPILSLTVAGKARRRLDGHTLARIVSENASWVVLAIIEDVHSMPKQGVASSFTFGKVAGAIEQCLIDHKIPYTPAHPAGWKRFFQITADKDSSRQRASQLLPAFAHLWARKKDDGRAEAALLALYGAKLHGQTTK